MEETLQALLIWFIVVTILLIFGLSPAWILTFSFLLGFLHRDVDNLLNVFEPPDDDDEEPFY